MFIAIAEFIYNNTKNIISNNKFFELNFKFYTCIYVEKEKYYHSKF